MTTAPIRWPRGFKVTFFAKIRKHRERILNGRVLAIDPATGATSNPGFCLREAGIEVAAGEIRGLRGETPERLQQLFWRLHDDERFRDIDVLVIEQLRGSMVAAQLHWSVGTIIAALPAGIVCECPIAAWKAYVRTDPAYVKGDVADARAMCGTVLAIAAGRDLDPPTASRKKKRGGRAGRRKSRTRSVRRCRK